jgi:hypothetical protein
MSFVTKDYTNGNGQRANDKERLAGIGGFGDEEMTNGKWQMANGK